MVRFLTRNGCTFLREGGRHTILLGPNGVLVIPRHGDIKPGVLQAILKQAEISRDRWGRL